ncbi:MAG: DUF6893 family small protein [Actinomycetes bacterium]
MWWIIGGVVAAGVAVLAARNGKDAKRYLRMRKM